MAERIPQSAALRVPLKAYLAADHVTAATGLTLAVQISKNGAAFGNPSAGATNATEIANGWYYVDLSTTDTATVGPLIVRGTAATADASEVAHDVAAFSVTQTGDAYTRIGANGAGLTAIPTIARVTLVDTVTTYTGNTPQTGDAYARLGAPAGASVSADVAATKALLPTALVGGKMDSHVNDIASGAITATSIAADAITAAKIADGAIDAATFASGALDAVWSTAARTLTSFGTLAADVWASVTRTLTAGTNIVLAKGTGVTGFNDPAAATTATAVRTELTTELALIASNNAGISAIYNNIGVPQDWGSGATIKGNLDDANSWINVIMAAVIDSGYGNAALKALIDALPAAVRDVNNGSPAAGSWGEASRNADAKASSILIALGTPADTVSADIAAIASAIVALNNLSAAELATALDGADDAVLAAIAALNNLSSAQVAGVLAAATVSANVTKVNGVTVDGAGTVSDPWGPV